MNIFFKYTVKEDSYNKINNNMVRLLISGYRHYNDASTIESVIMEALGDEKGVTIIHGGCYGVDIAADKVADKHGFKKQVFNADWSKGKSAGPIRNKRMITDGKPDYAIVFLSKHSVGTRNMIELLVKYRIPHRIIEID